MISKILLEQTKQHRRIYRGTYTHSNLLTDNRLALSNPNNQSIPLSCKPSKSDHAGSYNYMPLDGFSDDGIGPTARIRIGDRRKRCAAVSYREYTCT